METVSNQTAAAAQDLIFAMDIGTRSVMGIVGVPENRLFRVLDVETIEHDERSVIDGQIEDIGKVSAVARSVKERIEARMGVTFRNVCVAAAGRALRTQNVSFTFSVDPKTAFTQQMVFSLEMGAVDEAKRLLVESAGPDMENLVYSCVGYSVIRYFLDDYPMKTLLNHKGKSARVELIATFLPGEVVESLTEAMHRAGLRVGSMTLEPIAAMNVVIPEELRMLNLALVDVGAGTSDIAISNEGSVAAYAMATVAGDEITEAIAKEYLVDFHTAERIKFAMSEASGEIPFQNILGFDYSVTSAEVLSAIRTAVENLGSVIAEKILEVNGKPPAAVFLVGGGSLTPGLADIVADRVGLGRSKVAVGGGNYIKRNVVSDLPINGPEYATPLGIAVTAAMNLGEDGFFVYVNDVKTRLFKRELITVMDALLMGGYRHDQIIGRSGASLTFELNRQKKVIRGEYAETAEITCNGKQAAPSTLVAYGDRIVFRPAISGKDALYTVRDAIRDAGPAYAIYNKERVPIKLSARLNGKAARLKDQLKNGDELLVFSDVSLDDFCASIGLDPQAYRLFLNGAEKDGKSKVRQGDLIELMPLEGKQPIQDAIPIPASPLTHTDINQQQSKAPPSSAASTSPASIPAVSPAAPGAVSSPAVVPTRTDPVQTALPLGETLLITLNGAPFELPKRADGNELLFLDLFSYVDIDPKKPQGTRIVLQLNGLDASYLDPLAAGDEVRIYWEK